MSLYRFDQNRGMYLRAGLPPLDPDDNPRGIRVNAGVITLAKSDNADGKQSDADGDYTFPCRFVKADKILYGMNGVILVEPDELKQSAASGAGKPFNADHDWRALAQFGQIDEVTYHENDDEAWQEASIRLFVKQFKEAEAAKTVVEKRTVRFVSSELDYEYTVCSICGHERGKWEIGCKHVQDHLGEVFNGQVVYEILRGVVVDGGALTRFPADDEAAILKQAQSRQSVTLIDDKENTMSVNTNTPDGDKQTPEVAANGAAEGEEAIAANAEGDEAEAVEPAATDDEVKPEAQPEAEAQAQQAVGDTGIGDDDAAKKLAAELAAKLDLKEKEIASLTAQLHDLEELNRDLKYEVRRTEVRSVIEELKRKREAEGDPMDDSELWDLHWRYMEMDESQFVGVKEMILTMNSCGHERLSIALLSRAEPQKPDGAPARPAAPTPRPAAQSAAPKTKKQTNVPVGVPDYKPEDIPSRIKSAFGIEED